MTRAGNEKVGQLDASICIPTWNGKDRLLACVRSVAASAGSISLEVIVVDNGSSDGTAAVLLAEFPDAEVLRNDANEGFPVAVNQALRVARGRYLVVLNDDVVLRSDTLTKIVQAMEGQPTVGLLGCRVVFPDGSVQHTAHDDPNWLDYVYSALFLNRLFPKSTRFGRIDRTYLDYLPGLVVDTDWLGGVILVARAEAVSRIGLLDEKIFAFSEDWDWCRRFVSGGYRVLYWALAEIVHDHGSSSMRYTGPERESVREKSVLRMTAAALYVFRKHHRRQRTARILFDLSFRLHCLSRSISYWLHGVIRPSLAQPGLRRGYAKSAFTPYASLAARYLRQPTRGLTSSSAPDVGCGVKEHHGR